MLKPSDIPSKHPVLGLIVVRSINLCNTKIESWKGLTPFIFFIIRLIISAAFETMEEGNRQWAKQISLRQSRRRFFGPQKKAPDSSCPPPLMRCKCAIKTPTDHQNSVRIHHDRKKSGLVWVDGYPTQRRWIWFSLLLLKVWHTRTFTFEKNATSDYFFLSFFSQEFDGVFFLSDAAHMGTSASLADVLMSSIYLWLEDFAFFLKK